MHYKRFSSTAQAVDAETDAGAGADAGGAVSITNNADTEQGQVQEHRGSKS